MTKKDIKKVEIIKMSEEEHKAYHRRLAYTFLMIMIVLFGGATFYHYVEKWRYLDSVYFSSYTLTTVGYGDFAPKTDAGKIFTIVYVFMGVGIALYGLSLLSAHFVEVREEYWLQRMEKIRLKHHTQNFWDKIKNVFNYRSGEIVKEYENSLKKKK